VICGDFNADPQSDEIRMMTGQTAVEPGLPVFHDAWTFANPLAPGLTWDNANPYVAAWLEPDRRIDYIFTGWPKARGAGHITDCRIVANTPINGIWASDHHALLARLRY
jgi:endonuclease/exonuclease/phosphatase family metal-dependent hydrolase